MTVGHGAPTDFDVSVFSAVGGLRATAHGLHDRQALGRSRSVMDLGLALTVLGGLQPSPSRAVLLVLQA